MKRKLLVSLVLGGGLALGIGIPKAQNGYKELEAATKETASIGAEVSDPVLETIVSGLKCNEALILSAKIKLTRKSWYSGKYYSEELTADLTGFHKEFFAFEGKKFRYDSRAGRNGKLDPWEIRQVFDGEKTVRVNQAYDDTLSTVMIIGGNDIPNMSSPWNWGRKYLLPLSEWVQKKEAKITEVILPEGGTKGYLLEVPYNDTYGEKMGSIKAWIDPMKSFCAPRIEDYRTTADKSGEKKMVLFVLYEFDFKNVKDVIGGSESIFFVLEGAETIFVYNKKAGKAEPCRTEKYHVDEYEINKKLSSNVFTPPFPPGASVHDERTGVGFFVPKK